MQAETGVVERERFILLRQLRHGGLDDRTQHRDALIVQALVIVSRQRHAGAEILQFHLGLVQALFINLQLLAAEGQAAFHAAHFGAAAGFDKNINQRLGDIVRQLRIFMLRRNLNDVEAVRLDGKHFFAQFFDHQRFFDFVERQLRRFLVRLRGQVQEQRIGFEQIGFRDQPAQNFRA